MTKKETFYIAIIVILSIALITTFTFMITNFLNDKRIEVLENVYEMKLQEKDDSLQEYKVLAKDVIEIKNKYRIALKEVVDLLYNKNMPLFVGGVEQENILSKTDELVLLQMRNTIQTMEDDRRLFSEVKNFLTAREEFIRYLPVLWPVSLTEGVPRITSGFGIREDFTDPNDHLHYHAGIDIAGEEGDSVYATANGSVKNVLYRDDLGWVIVIMHKNGIGTAYAHLSRVLVVEGQYVNRGDLIAEVGNTGYSSLGPHLHYEIRENGMAIDPMKYLTNNF